MVRATALVLALLVTIVLLPETVAKEDLLDIKALGFEPVGPVYSGGGFISRSIRALRRLQQTVRC